MKPVKIFHLICEPVISFGRFVAIVGIIAIIFDFFAFTYPDIVSGEINRYDLQATFFMYFSYGLFLFFIVAGFIGHRMQKWYEYKIELYPDNWMRTILIHPEGFEEPAYIPPDLLCSVSKYKKRYSRRRKNWYIRLSYEFYHDGKLYGVDFYGWVVAPKDIKEFDDFANLLRELAKENRKRIKGKIPPKILAYGVRTWLNSEYGQKVFEEREKLAGGERGW